jgi:hypothetical protein
MLSWVAVLRWDSEDVACGEWDSHSSVHEFVARLNTFVAILHSIVLETGFVLIQDKMIQYSDINAMWVSRICTSSRAGIVLSF